MKRPLKPIIFLFLSISLVSCASISEIRKRDYGILESAVTFSSDKVIGEFGDAIPSDFSSEDFLKLIEGKIPREYYATLKKYFLEIRPKGSYYLLLVFDPESRELILFDYSCTPEVDGPVLLEPHKYDIKNLELYDKCGKS